MDGTNLRARGLLVANVAWASWSSWSSSRPAVRAIVVARGGLVLENEHFPHPAALPGDKPGLEPPEIMLRVESGLRARIDIQNSPKLRTREYGITSTSPIMLARFPSPSSGVQESNQHLQIAPLILVLTRIPTLAQGKWPKAQS
ncbi:uncharacterized protein B0I36DRAFT_355398 [Microdochium trichocladiopsis]|uniref:Uncharacterized protein n=1 Tax=Microdochium trichocladiopsis TaxID=1682393 RepID=A0A9P8XT68_9PEZI|nr:uncharacterized protein B0I36DRAFT_355398 [Microdochium trichocladiopsis]KAH7014136.1 hypothetical protein B0I36DRAFT_355398 [Microdochium trichocladiopsis]